MKKRNDKPPRIRLLLLGIMALFLLLTIVPRAKIVYDLNKQKIVLEQDKENLADQNAQLQESMQEVNSPANIERIAREQLGLVKNGETIIIPILPEQYSTDQ